MTEVQKDAIFKRPINSHLTPEATPSVRRGAPVFTLIEPRPIIPRAYPARVIDAAVVRYPWRQTQTNPAGLVARVFVEVSADDGPAHLCDVADSDAPHKLVPIFEACGLTVDPCDALNRLHELPGRECAIVSKNICPRQGRNAGVAKAAVSSWISRS